MQCGATIPNECGCPGGGTTTLSGTVYAPNGTLPLPNAFVYVPSGNAPPYGMAPFVDGVANGNGCSCSVTGIPMVSTTTAVDGSFTITSVPSGANIPLVIQLGRWRRLVTIPSVAACTTTALSAGDTRLPTRQGESGAMDSIPFMALATGDVDGLECVLRKMGVADAEFTNPGGGGRIEIYQDNGARIDRNTPGYTQLTASQASVDQYDALIFPCRGSAHDEPVASKQRVLDVATNTSAYVNKGGRAFFTHFSYAWLYSIAPSNQLPWLSTTRSASVDGTHWDNDIQVQVNTSFQRGQTFSDWLALPAVGALSGTNPPQITVLEARENMHTPINLPITTAQEWLTTYRVNPSAALHVTFDTPWGVPPAEQCGRVLFSGFHVTTAGITGGHTQNLTFPSECSSEFTAQEKVLAYMMFDMTSCVKLVL
jgi:hypothetical protein